MDLKSNESIFVDYYECTTTEDDYAQGEIGGVIKNWDNRDVPLSNNNFKDIKSALKEVLDKNNLSHHKEWWYVWGNDMESDYGRFDYDVMVDEYEHEATEDQIKQWTNGNLRLYNLHIVVLLSIKKDFTKEDLNNIQL